MPNKEITLQQFLFNAKFYIQDVAIRRGQEEILVTSSTGSSLLTFGYGGKTPKPERTENLEKYKRNKRAEVRALERVFNGAMEGKTIGLKSNHWRGKSFAILTPAPAHDSV